MTSAIGATWIQSDRQMNLYRVSGFFRSLVFRSLRSVTTTLPRRRISAFGPGSDRIGSIMVLNLDRQTSRWHRVSRELDRFKTFDGVPLTSIVTRLASVDARDGRAVAATADVDPNYRLGDQLHVQPDPHLEACFCTDEPVRMTRQEVAVTRSHIEAWKAIAAGEHKHVLILEDDVWFKPRAASAIDRGWLAALKRRRAEGGPHLLYLSYEDAGGTAERAEPCNDLFQPKRGLWFLSGYVLSREGAAALLRQMPVKGPVDMWMNYRLQEQGALALSSPAILQRPDCVSDNSYSVLPYLARAGIVNTSSGPLPPERTRAGPVLAWTARGDREDLAMALSMLGLRVRVFDEDEKSLSAEELADLTLEFDALVGVPLKQTAIATAMYTQGMKFFLEAGTTNKLELDPASLPSSRTTVLACENLDDRVWEPICSLLDLLPPPDSFPVGALRSERLFRDDREDHNCSYSESGQFDNFQLDDSPWVLPRTSGWQPRPPFQRSSSCAVELLVREAMKTPTPLFPALVETFPGNLASFAKKGIQWDEEGAHLIMEGTSIGERPYRSGAFASAQSFGYGRFEAEIKAAAGSGVVTGFFLHRSMPRQEIDVEFAGNYPRILLVNVYFNPGDKGAAMAYGYRGAPSRIDLGFDATEDFHHYAIDWRPGLITWSVDGKVVHERVGWDPTPIPHLPMTLFGNLWAPRSEDFAGRINEQSLPARAGFRNVAVFA